MIVHVHSDGSRGFQYEPGDRVIVERTVQGGWFDYGPTRADRCTVLRQRPFTRHRPVQWRIDFYEVHYSDGWGPAECSPRMLRPHPDAFVIGSDGESGNWVEGVHLAKLAWPDVADRIDIPRRVRDDSFEPG